MRNGESHKLFNIVMICFGLGLFSLWFFLHPNSPWHTRNTYVVGFAQVGSLAPGDGVMVNGLSKGKVVSTTLTDTCVWVNMKVLANVSVPRDSRFFIENAGLMGERVVNIRLGKTHLFMESGDSVNPGTFDQGSTSLGVGLARILREVGGILGNVQGLVDTLTAPERIEDYERMGKKANRIRHQLPSLLRHANHSLDSIFGNLSLTAQKLDTLGQIGTDLEGLSAEIQELIQQWNALEPRLKQVGSDAAKVVDAVSDNSGTVALMLAEDSQVKQELESLSKHAQALLEKIKKRGLDMNVDIW
jgi:phospholipid/cholesterol/gamma-HCH transport system substrate-binding protein